MKQTITDTHVPQRNYGIDLLRLVAAFYVIILHTLNYGGVYHAAAPNSYQELLCRFLLVVSFCAVNIFGIISGYVGYREPLKNISYSGYLPLWLTVVFYYLLFCAIYWFILPEAVTVRDLAMAFTPVTSDLHWYFSAYTVVYFFSPFLNRLLYASSEKELKLLFLLICFVLVTVEYIGHPFAFEGGYSAIWLLLLYLVGGIMKKTGIGSRLPASAAFFLIIVIDICFFYIGLKRPALTVFLFELSLDVRYSYVMPVYVATALLHVILFSKLTFCTALQKIIKFSAPAAFSVYIANTTPLFWDNFMPNRFAPWGTCSPAGILVRTLVFAFVYVAAVIIVDFFRQKLFCLLGVQKWVRKRSAFFVQTK